MGSLATPTVASTTVPAKRRSLFFVKLTISIFLAAYILHAVDLSRLGGTLSGARESYILLLVGLFFLFVILGGLRTAVILRATVNRELPIGTIVRRYFVANAFGAFTPAQTGEFSLGSLLKEHGVRTGQGVVAVLLDKVIMLVLFLISSIVAVAVYFPGADLWLLAAGPVMAGTGLACLLVQPMRKWVRHRLVEPFFPRALPLGHMAVDFLLFRKRALALNVGLAVVRIAISALTIYFGLLAVGHAAAHLPDIFWLNGLVRTVTFIPISINGIGVLEGSAMKAFAAPGVEIAEEVILSAFILNRAIAYMISGTIVIRHMFKRR